MNLRPDPHPMIRSAQMEFANEVFRTFARATRLMTQAAAALLMAMTLASSPAWSQDFAAPKGEVLLTASGKITATNSDGALKLDQAQLAALPQYSFTTSTTWTEDTPRSRVSC